MPSTTVTAFLSLIANPNPKLKTLAASKSLCASNTFFVIWIDIEFNVLSRRKDANAEGGVTALSTSPLLSSSSATDPVDCSSLPPGDSENDTREIAGYVHPLTFNLSPYVVAFSSDVRRRNGAASTDLHQERTAQDTHAGGNASATDLRQAHRYSLLDRDFVLNGVQTVGSNLPGIGAVSVVLAATDKLKVCRGYRKVDAAVYLTTCDIDRQSKQKRDG